MKYLLFLIDVVLCISTSFLVNEKLGWVMALIWFGWCANLIYSAWTPRVYVIYLGSKKDDKT